MEIILLIIILIVLALIIKYFLNPIFFSPKFRINEITNYLKQKDNTLIEIKYLKKEGQKNSPFINRRDVFNKIYYSESYYVIISLNKKTLKYCKYWLQVKKVNNFFGKRQINFRQELNEDVLIKLQQEYDGNGSEH